MAAYSRIPLRALGLVTLASLVTALFLNLGAEPLNLEEPRRALIALEMIYNGDLLTPTEFGQLYFNKPPLWNWVIIAAFRLFGGYTEFAVRFFSVLSLLVAGGVMFLLGRRYLDREQALLSAFLFMVCGDLLLYFSLIGEIDLFYAAIGFTSFAALFHFYQQGRYWLAFPLFYLLSALGVLTKGLPSVAFAGITLGTLLLYRRDLRRLWSGAHLAGVLVFALVAGSYFLLYALHHPDNGFLARLWLEASERTVVGTQGDHRLLQHLVGFPLDTLKAVLPASLLLPFLFRPHPLRHLRRNPLIEFYLWTGLANFALYWFSPGATQRYIYALYPALVTLLVWSRPDRDDPAPHRRRLVRGLVLLFMALAGVAFVALPFVPETASVAGVRWVATAGFALVAGLLLLVWRRPSLGPWGLVWAAIGLRLGMDLAFIPYRAEHGGAARLRATAQRIADRAPGEPVHLYRDTTGVRTIVFYLERASGQVVRRERTPIPGGLFMVESGHEPEVPYRVLLNFEDDEGRHFTLVRFPAAGEPPGGGGSYHHNLSAPLPAPGEPPGPDT